MKREHFVAFSGVFGGVFLGCLPVRWPKFFAPFNALKQLEIKRFGYVLPVGLALTNKKRRNWRPLLAIGLTAGLALSISTFRKQIGLSNNYFDTSGHFITKTATASIVSHALDREECDLAVKAAWLYTATDLVLLTYTTAYCHTLAEVAAGIGVGGLIAFGAHRISNVKV